MMLLLVAVCLFALPLVVEALRIPVAKRRIGKVPGQLVKLSKGVTHILTAGPADGPVAVLVHGLTTPIYLFGGVIPQLVNAGYRVVTYDLYGRGLSDRPLGRQNGHFFVDQLNDVLKHEGVKGPYLLLGYSMGGAIAATKAAQDPDDISHLVLVASTGLLPANTPKLAEWPIIGDWVMWVFGGLLLRKRLASPTFTASVVPDLPAREALETRTKGYLPAVLSSMRQLVQTDLSPMHKRIAEADIPVLAIWGAMDRSVSLQSMARLAELNPDAWHHQIDDGDHGIIHNRPGEVGAEVLRFLRSRSSSAD